jgi:predicted glycoside hydrolase/deacetylase ChbG (UPF0249 family)
MTTHVPNDETRRGERFLIVNADDFGLSDGINAGTIEAHEHGIVTSASLMVRGPAAPAAAEYAQSDPSLSIGLHLDLGEWIYRNEAWEPLYEVIALDDPAAVAAVAARQLDTFCRLVGHSPTHLDSHQHVHRDEPLRTVAIAVARELAIPLRHFSSGIRYCGGFYGQSAKGDPLPGAIGVEALIALLHALPSGVTELGCHPGWAENLESSYRVERAIEVKTLCDPRVREAVSEERIALCSFHDAQRIAKLAVDG